MKVKSFTQTCIACPSQWEGLLEDDRPFYVRYRWGYLCIDVGPIGDTIDNLRNWKLVYARPIGDDLDSLISWEKVNGIMEGL